MYTFAPEENYHLHALKVAKDLGFKTHVIVKGNKENIMRDPHFDTDTEVIDYKNNFQFFFHIIKFSFQNSLFYVNSCEWQSFIIPFLARKTIFMAHTQPKRQTRLKQKIQNFVYNFFTAVRLNNEKEKEFLLQQGIPEKKLFVIPLVVSRDVFKLTDTHSERKDLVYFGNVTAVKNPITIIEAFKIVIEKYPEIKLHIIGEIFEKEFLDKIHQYKISDNVILHGYKKQDDSLSQLLNTMKISLNSSISEGQCVAIYDTALCGCVLCLPNIMSFTGVFKESALFHDVMDYKKMAQNIIYYLENPALVKKHQAENIEMIQKNYSLETVESNLKKLILKAK